MTKEERIAFIRGMNEAEEQIGRTYFTPREKWVRKKDAAKATAGNDIEQLSEAISRQAKNFFQEGTMGDKTYERIHDDALRVIKELGFRKYTVDMLDTFTYELTTMKENLEWQAKKRTAVAEAIPEAAQCSPRLFSLLETESDELG